jgi:hypothetical protein
MCDCRPCGECKHWHEIEQTEYKCRLGRCDKIPKGTLFEDDDGNSYHFDPEVFDDEIYTDALECFEEKDDEKN